MTTIIACGLKREAALIHAAMPDARIVSGGGDSTRLARELESLSRSAPAVILSVGIAGGLDPALPCGAVIVDGSPVLADKIRAVLKGGRRGLVAGGDQIVSTVAEKSALRSTTGASVADMESHVASRIAAILRLPYAAIRIVSDTAEEALPPAALVGMAPDGSMALGAVLWSLAKSPAQLPALIRTGANAGRAFRVLGDVCDALGRAGVGNLDPVEFPLHL